MAGKNHTLTGKIYWAKVLGEPVPNFDGDENEWTFEVSPNERGVELLKRLGVGEKFKNKDDERGDFVTFKRNEINKQKGKRNNNIPVFDNNGAPWDEDVEIGNGSTVAVKFNIFEGKWKTKTYTKLIPYEIKVVELVKRVPKIQGNPAKVNPDFLGEDAPMNKIKPKPPAKGNDWEAE